MYIYIHKDLKSYFRYQNLKGHSNQDLKDFASNGIVVAESKELLSASEFGLRDLTGSSSNEETQRSGRISPDTDWYYRILRAKPGKEEWVYQDFEEILQKLIGYTDI
jgi:hypothetical protein